MTHLLNLLQEKLKLSPSVKIPIFFDYDGTLSPIVAQPEQAVLDEQIRENIKILAKLTPVGVVSGRGLLDVKEKVNIDNVWYAGSHGYEIIGPNGEEMIKREASEALLELDRAEKELLRKLSNIKGSRVERKKYAIATHYRNVGNAKEEAELVQIVKEVKGNYALLKEGPGKKVIELRPALEWGKGDAILWIMKSLKILDFSFPVYLGDDLTDEDAFSKIKGNGLGILVGDHGHPTSATEKLQSTEEVKYFVKGLVDIFAGIEEAK